MYFKRVIKCVCVESWWHILTHRAACAIKQQARVEHECRKGKDQFRFRVRQQLGSMKERLNTLSVPLSSLIQCSAGWQWLPHCVYVCMHILCARLCARWKCVRHHVFCNTAAVLSCAWTADAQKRFFYVIKNECISLNLKSAGLSPVTLWAGHMWESELSPAELSALCRDISGKETKWVREEEWMNCK